LIGATAMLGALASAVSALFVRSEPPRLDLPQSVEATPLGEPSHATAEVRMSNPCSYPVEILELAPACACTAVEIPALVLQPGQSQALRIHVELSHQPVQTNIEILLHAVGSSVVARQSIAVRAPPINVNAAPPQPAPTM